LWCLVAMEGFNGFDNSTKRSKLKSAHGALGQAFEYLRIL
jgi:hypothetical protein